MNNLFRVYSKGVRKHSDDLTGQLTKREAWARVLKLRTLKQYLTIEVQTLDGAAVWKGTNR